MESVDSACQAISKGSRPPLAWAIVPIRRPSTFVDDALPPIRPVAGPRFRGRLVWVVIGCYGEHLGPVEVEGVALSSRGAAGGGASLAFSATEATIA